MASERHSFLPWLTAGFFSLSGVFCLGTDVFLSLQAGATHKWDTASGEVLEVISGEHLDGIYGGNSPNLKVVTYEYQVDGRSYTGNRYSLETGFVAREIPKLTDSVRAKIPSEFTEGDTITIYYPPKDHGSSLIVPGRYDLGTFSPRFLGGVLSLSVGSHLFTQLRKKRAKA